MIELDDAWLRTHPLPQPGADTDKNKRGRVLVAGGSSMVPGALLLTGEAAFRAGAGKVQLATVEPAAMFVGLRMPEAAVYGLPANADGELAGSAGGAICHLLDRCDALLIGPGMGAKADASHILRTLLSEAQLQTALILDAAMIGALAALETKARNWSAPLLLTPHPGEMARLMACDETEISPDLAVAAARRFNATVILKASETWIAAPDAVVLHYTGGGPGLATGGSGDVLAGIIAALLARGASPQIAAGWGVWLHGEAGLVLAKRVGLLGFLARELLGEIPGLMMSGTS